MSRHKNPDPALNYVVFVGCVAVAVNRFGDFVRRHKQPNTRVLVLRTVNRQVPIMKAHNHHRRGTGKMFCTQQGVYLVVRD